MRFTLLCLEGRTDRMPMDNLTTLLGIPGFKVIDTKRQKRDGRSRVILSLEREPGYAVRCDGCGEGVERVRPYRTRWVRHLHLWQHTTFRSEEHTSELQSLRHLVCR